MLSDEGANAILTQGAFDEFFQVNLHIQKEFTFIPPFNLLLPTSPYKQWVVPQAGPGHQFSGNFPLYQTTLHVSLATDKLCEIPRLQVWCCRASALQLASASLSWVPTGQASGDSLAIRTLQ